MQRDTADRIREIAHTLISDRGYAAFSYADIAEAVGISKASIHHHFPTKANLVVAIVREHREHLLTGMRQLAQQVEDPLARLRIYVGHWETCIRDQTKPFCVAAMLAAELPGLPEEVQQEVRQFFLELGFWIRDTLEAGVQTGTITLVGTAEDEAQSLMALVHGAMLSARALGSASAFTAVTSQALRRLSTHSDPAVA